MKSIAGIAGTLANHHNVGRLRQGQQIGMLFARPGSERPGLAVFSPFQAHSSRLGQTLSA